LVDPVLVLGDEPLNVEPGGEVRATVTVRNVGDLVEQYRLEVLGDAARWSQIVPRQISVLPGGSEEKTVVVVFRPPAPPVTVAGDVPFGLRCVSLEAPDRCAVVEGDLVVGAVVGVQARLENVTPAGRWNGRYQVVLENTGSVPVRLRLAASDSRRMLRFAVAPPEITVEPGRSAPAYVSVQPRQPALRGKSVSHGFSVGYQTVDGDQRGELAGVFEQRPIISKGVIAACLLLVGLAAAGVVLLLRTGAGGGHETPVARSVPPPPIALTAATRVGGNSVQLVWQRSPYATGYVVQQLLTGGGVGDSKEVADRDQSALVWPGLPPGKHCFQVVAVGPGGRSGPSQPKCATVPKPRPSTSLAPSSSAATAGPSAGPGAGPLPGVDPVQGFYVVYVPPTAVDDPATQGVADKEAARLQRAGIPAVLVNSLQSQRLADGPGGLWVVLRDGFATYEDALAECDKHRDVAPDCYAQR
jgi:hypothetical protein